MTSATKDCITLLTSFSFLIAIWLGIGALLHWVYNACVVPLGAPTLGYRQTLGICFLLGFAGKVLFKRG